MRNVAGEHYIIRDSVHWISGVVVAVINFGGKFVQWLALDNHFVLTTTGVLFLLNVAYIIWKWRTKIKWERRREAQWRENHKA